MASDKTVAVFASVDALDSEKFASYFAPDGKITFGNNPTAVGRQAVFEGTAGFLGTIDGIRHEIVNEWNSGNDTIVELAVTYNRKDGGVVTIPVVSVWTTGAEGLIDDYRVFFDVAPVFA